MSKVPLTKAIRAIWARELKKEPLERAIERERYVRIAALIRYKKDSEFFVPRRLRKDKSFWDEVKRRKKS